jgi:hypothetical protein
MNKHIILEETPHGTRTMVLSAVLSCSMFFVLGFFGRDVWNYHVGNAANGLSQCAPDQTVGAPRRTLQWRLPDEPKK